MLTCRMMMANIRLFSVLAAAMCLPGCSGCDATNPRRDGSMADADARDGAADTSTPTDTGRRDTFVPPPSDVHVRISGDNAYGFGYGNASGLFNYFNGREAIVACEIFCCSAECTSAADCGGETCDIFGTCNDDGRGPETYVVPGSETSATDYLYIVAWSDDRVTQGVIGQFVAQGGGDTIYTGDARFEVCATGMDFDPPSGGPDEVTIAAAVASCETGGGVSGGWVNSAGRDGRALSVGENNEAGDAGDFPGACATPGRGDAIDFEARWMWYDPDTSDGDPNFRSTDPDGGGEFLIFRLQIGELLI